MSCARSSLKLHYRLSAQQRKHHFTSLYYVVGMKAEKWFGNRVVPLLLVIVGLSLTIVGATVVTSLWVDNLLLSAASYLKDQPPTPHWPDKVRRFGGDALLGGVLIASFGSLVLWREALEPLTQKKHFLTAVAILVLSTLWLPIALLSLTAKIAGERYWWLSDDAMVSMRYARNLVEGTGLVYNPGEKVEGYTNFLWTLYMAFVHLFPIPESKISLVILLTSVALAAATVPVIVRLVRVLGGGTLATAATLAAYVLSGPAMYWGTDGLETVLLTFVFLVATYRVLQEGAVNKASLPTYLLIATISLVRADAIVLSALLYGVSLFLNKKTKVVLLYSAISLLLPIGHEVFRLYYYGEALPNTAYLRTANWDNKYVAGLNYVLSFAKHYAIPIALAAVGAIRSRHRSQYALLTAVFLYMVYVVYAGGDHFLNFRFLIPVLPLLMALAFVGIQNLWSTRGRQLIVSMLCLVSTPLIIPGYSAIFFPDYVVWGNWGNARAYEYMAGNGNIRIALLLKQNTLPSSKVADFAAGSVFYFSERYGVDLLGKVDRHVARLPAAPNTTRPGHNKYDFTYSLGEFKPDFVLSEFKLPVREDEMRLKTTGNDAYKGTLYFNPSFHEHCLPNSVSSETWRTVFVCDWSSQVGNNDDWKELPLTSADTPYDNVSYDNMHVD